MSNLSYRSNIGTPTFDLARYSAEPKPVERLQVFTGGMFVFELPRMPNVKAVEAPGQGGDVLIYLREPMPQLDRIVSPDMPARHVRARSLILIPDGLMTNWYAETGQPLCHHIHFSRALREEWVEDFGRGNLRPVINRSSADVDQIFGRIMVELGAQDPFRRLKLQGLALSALAASYRLGDAQIQIRRASQAMTPARLRRVRSYIEENLDSEVCLEDMAACVGLSPSHFSRAFRAETGMSPYAWVVQARVERVKDRLLNSRRSLAEIALDCGFASQSHMTETFRRNTGLPPARWLSEQGRRQKEEIKA